MHGDPNATYKNLGNWAGHLMLLYCVCTGDEHIFFVSGTFYYIKFFKYFLKIKGEGLNDLKKVLFVGIFIYWKIQEKLPSFLGLLRSRHKPFSTQQRCPGESIIAS